MRLTVDALRHYLDVFLWENPDWADCAVVMEEVQGGRVYARKANHGKGFDIAWEERIIYEPATGRPEDSI
jgi:hypothetical protein